MFICHFGQKSYLPKPWLTWKLLLIAHFIFEKSVTTAVKSGDLLYLVHSCMLALCAQSIFLFLLECLPAVCSSLQGLCHRDSRSSRLNLMTLCRSVVFWGRSSLSLLGFFNFSPVPHPFSVTAWAMCFWLQVKEAVKHALSVGYRHIDCAAAYSNEAEIGEAFQECVGPNKVKAQELPCWRCAVPTLTAVPFEVNICGFSCWSSPAVCYLSGKAWRRAFSS